MQASAVTVEPRLLALLPQPVFADAWSAPCAAAPDARQAALAIFNTTPAWVGALMALRNTLVRPFKLKTDLRRLPAARGRIGMFPVLEETPQEMLMGLDDRHLDFRLSVSVRPAAAGVRSLTITTVVHTHNRLGRLYLAAILPFHRLIARRLLVRAVRRLGRLPPQG